VPRTEVSSLGCCLPASKTLPLSTM
jgi:hypothetical protein